MIKSRLPFHWFILVFILTTNANCKKDPVAPVDINPCGIDFGTTLHYVAIGDGFSNGEYLEEGQAWPYFVKNRLEELNHVITDFDQFGVDNDDSASLLAAVESDSPECKNLVTLMVGAEDHFEGRTLEQFRASYHDLLIKAVAIAGNPDRVTCVSLPNYSVTPGLPSSTGTPEEARLFILEMNSIILDEVNMAGANYADIFPISTNVYANLQAYTPEDQLHGDQYHNNIWGEIIVAVVDANL